LYEFAAASRAIDSASKELIHASQWMSKKIIYPTAQPLSKACVWKSKMLLSTPTFNVEILPNALAALPELFAGLDDVLPALDVQLEETWSGEKGPATEVLITANIEQALLDSRPIFLVDPKPDPTKLASLLDTGRPVRWVSKGTGQGDWVDSFARFMLTLRVSECTKAKQSKLYREKNSTKSISASLPKRRKKAS